MSTTGALLQSATLIQIFEQANFPDIIGGEIPIQSNIHYRSGAFSIISAPFRFSDNESVNQFSANSSVLDVIVWIGSGALFRSNSVGTILVENIAFVGIGTNILFDIDGTGSEQPFMVFRNCTFSNIRLGHINNTLIFINELTLINHKSPLFISNAPELNILNSRPSQSPVSSSSNLPAFSLLDGNFGMAQIKNNQPSLEDGESFLHIGKSATFDVLQIIGNPIVETPLSKFLKTGTTGTITSFSDAGGGLTEITSTSHGLITHEPITITGTTSYNGGFDITVTGTDTFTIDRVFVADDATGTWDSESANELTPNVVIKDNDNIPETPIEFVKLKPIADLPSEIGIGFIGIKLDGNLYYRDNLTADEHKILLQSPPIDLTINNGEITVPNSASLSVITDTESGTSTDNLDTINGGSPGNVIIISIKNSSRKITITNLTGNINTTVPVNQQLKNISDIMILRKAPNGDNRWDELTRSINDN